MYDISYAIYSICECWLCLTASKTTCASVGYWVASISKLLKIIGLFCKGAQYKRRYSAKGTYHFKEPTNRSHPIVKFLKRRALLSLRTGNWVASQFPRKKSQNAKFTLYHDKGTDWELVYYRPLRANTCVDRRMIQVFARNGGWYTISQKSVPWSLYRMNLAFWEIVYHPPSAIAHINLSWS